MRTWHEVRKFASHIFRLAPDQICEAFAAGLCSHTFSVGLNPETSMALI